MQRLGRLLSTLSLMWALGWLGGASALAQQQMGPEVGTFPILANGTSPGGLTAADVSQLLEEGHGPTDISRADALSAHYGVSVRDLLARHSACNSWEDVTVELSRRSPQSEVRDLPDEALSVVVQDTLLPEATLSQLRAQGYSLLDISQAQRYAKDNGLSATQVLEMKGSADWEQLARTLGTRANFSLTPELAAQTGLDEQALQALLERGYALQDIIQASALAQGSNRTFEELMALKEGRDWASVAQELFPDAPLPLPPSFEGASAQQQPSVGGEDLPAASPECGREGPQQVTPLRWECTPGYWYFVPGYSTYEYEWVQVWVPGYYQTYWYYNWACGCLMLGWYYVPGYYSWERRLVRVWHPGQWIWIAPECEWVPDPLPPVTTPSYSPSSPTGSNGWYSSAFTVSLSATDSDSGVSRIEYGWDSVAGSSAIGASSTWATYTGPFGAPGDGVWRLRYRAIDNDGNVESTRSPSTPFRLDRVAPTLTSVRTTANTSGWNNTNVTVSFSCTDAVSGVSTCSGPVTLSSEGANQSTTGSARDMSGNQRSLSVTGINIDKTLPTLSATRTEANGYGWNNTDVTVSFACTDALSGVSACSGPVTLSSEGANQGASGSAADKAGNPNGMSVAGINIDKTAPTLSLSGGQQYLVDQTVLITCAASDSLSGLVSDPCTSPLVQAEAYAYNPGTYLASAEATDKAGNTASASASYTIVVTAGSLGNLVERFIPEGTPGRTGLVNSMQAQLRAIAAAAQRDNTRAKQGATQAFVNHVEAQTDKALPASKAAVLLRLVQAL